MVYVYSGSGCGGDDESGGGGGGGDETPPDTVQNIENHPKIR